MNAATSAIETLYGDLPGDAGGVVLTVKALEALRAMLASLEQKPMGEQLKEHTKAEGAVAVKVLVSEIIRSGLAVMGQQ